MKDVDIKLAVTSELVDATVEEVWKKLGFYEHVVCEPTWLLKTVLPVPRDVEGSHARVGDTCRCRYSDGGYLTKKITRIVDEQLIEFEIIEQSIRFQQSIKLLGGCIEIKEAIDKEVLVTMLTYFKHNFKPSRYMTCLIARVIKHMHRFVLRDLRAQLSQVHGQNNLSPAMNW